MFTAANIQKNAVKIPQFTKEIAVFLPQNMNLLKKAYVLIMRENLFPKIFLINILKEHYS